MKKKGLRIAKSALAVGLAVSMAFTPSISAIATGNDAVETQTTVSSAASTIEDINGDGMISYVAFGDSVTNGYGMDGYRYDDGTNVLGFRRDVEGSYPVEIKEYLEGKGWEVELDQLAISGFRMDELHWMLCDDYVSDYYHDTRFDDWNHSAIRRMLRSNDEEAKADAEYLREKYQATYGSDDAMIENADKIIMAEYREAVKEADFVTMDLGTNNFGTFLTSTIAAILTGGDIEEENVNFANYVDENTAKSLDGIIDQMAAQMAGGTDNQAFTLTRTLARCMMYGYLGYTEHYDGALDALYELNPNAQVIVLDMYTMISGVQLEGQALGDVDLDALYNLFINMANFYSNELSPYAQKVTHASLENDPALLIDDYRAYVYPDSQGTLVVMGTEDENGNIIPNKDYNETAVTLLNEFIMEAQDMDPDDPAQREKFQAEVADNIILLDTYVYDLQATIQEQVVDAQILPGINDSIEPIELAMDAIDLIYMAIEGVAAAKDGVELAVDGVITAQGAVTLAIEGVPTAEKAVTTAIEGVEKVNTAVEGVTLAQQIVDLLVENLIDHETYGRLFKGSSTSDTMKDMIVDKIKEYITEDIMEQAGFEPTDENKTKLAEEAYVMACVYYDTINVDGGTKEDANKAAIIEGLSYMLVETEGLDEAEAQETAELAYYINGVYEANGGPDDHKAGVIAAMATQITEEQAAEFGEESPEAVAALAYDINEIYEANGGADNHEEAYKAAVLATIAMKITDEQVSDFGASSKEEVAELAYDINEIYEANGGADNHEEAYKATVIAVVATQITEEQAAKFGKDTPQEAAEYAYEIYEIYEANGGSEVEGELYNEASVKAVVKDQLPEEALAEFGLTKEEGAQLAYDVAENYNALKAKDDDEKTAISTCLVEVAKVMGMEIDTATAELGYDLYVGVYKPALDGGADKATAKKETVLYALKSEFVGKGMDETTAGALAEAMYAVYKETATAEQQRIAYIGAMQIAGIDEATATAIYECYCPSEEGKDNLDGEYKNEYVQTAIKYFMTVVLEVTVEEAGELFDSYLMYKNVAEALGKISRLDTVYFDALLAEGAIDVDAIGDKIVAGTLSLDEPVQGADESDADFQERMNVFKSESSLAIFYFRFMAQDGVFTHPSKAGHQTFTDAIVDAMNNMVPDAEADQSVAVTKETSILSIGDAMVASDKEYNYTELIASKLGVTNVNYVQNNYARLEDFYNALTGETGDAFATEVVEPSGGIDSTLADKVKENDIILVNLGSMNLGYSAMQLAKYMSEETSGQTYKMTFADKENMSVRNLGATVDAFLVDFQKMLGVVDEEGNREDTAATSAGTIMLLLESYGYGITTFTNDFNNLMDKLHELNEDATIVLVGVGDMLGDDYFYDESTGAYFSLGAFYQHGAELLNGNMEKYAAQTSNVFYMDTMDAENLANSKETPSNIANAGSELLTNAHFTEEGHQTVASKVNCENFGVHFVSLTEQVEATCETEGKMVYSCVLCTDAENREEKIDALGHAYSDEVEEWKWTPDEEGNIVSASATVKCTRENCTHATTVTTTDIEVVTPDSASCIEGGEVEYSASVTIGDKVYTGTTTVVTGELSHAYSETPVWEWAKDSEGNVTGESATATFSCTREGCEHETSVDATITSEKTDKTCTTDGQIVYTAKVTFEEKDYTDDQMVVIPAGHEYEDGYCGACGQYDPSARPNPEGECVTITDAELTSGAELILILGGTEAGTYTFTETSDGWNIQTAEGKYVALSDGAITYSDTAFAWDYADGKFSAEETTTSTGGFGNIFGGIFGNWFGSSSTTTYYLVMTSGSLSVSTSETGADAAFATKTYADSHSYGEGVVTAPTCTENGYTTFTCTVCGNVVTMNETEATGHDYVSVMTAVTCTTDGYTTHTCTVCDDSYTDNYVEATGHEYGEDGICTHCGEEEVVTPTPTPTPEPEEGECTYVESVSLTNGELILSLGGTEVGTYVFAQVDGGWTIQTADGTYLALEDETLVYSASAFTWTYSNNRFSTVVESESSSNSGNNWFGNIFGNWFGSSSSSSTTYYLVASGDSVAVSTSTSGATASFGVKATGDHAYGEPSPAEGFHRYQCANCGYEKFVACSDENCELCNPTATINVSVEIKETTSSSGLGGIFGDWFGSSTTTYTAEITVTAEGTEISSVAYSTDGGSTWTEGTSFESTSEITNFDIRVEATNGTTYYFNYNDGAITAK